MALRLLKAHEIGGGGVNLTNASIPKNFHRPPRDGRIRHRKMRARLERVMKSMEFNNYRTDDPIEIEVTRLTQKNSSAG